MPTVDDELRMGIDCQRAGALIEAESHYRRALAHDRRLAMPWILLGTVADQQNDSALAVRRFDRALRLDPVSLPGMLHRGRALMRAGRLAEAEASFRRAATAAPEKPDPHLQLADLWRAQGKTELALQTYDTLLSRDPHLVIAAYNRAVLLHEAGRASDAMSAYQQTLRLKPDHAEAWMNLGLLLADGNHRSQALECYREALRHRPDFAEAWNNMGVCYAAQRELPQAVDCYSRALQQQPRYAAAFNNLGNALLRLDRPAEAVTLLRRATELEPRLVEAHANLGAALQRHRRLLESAACIQGAARQVAADNRDGDEAMACYCRALELDPQCLSALGQLVHELQHQCAWAELPNLVEATVAAATSDVQRQEDPLSPFVFITLPVATTAAQQREVSGRWARSRGRAALVPQPVTVGSDSPIRVGYLSADFRTHPVAELIVELFETHDRSRVCVTGYSYGPDDQSPLRARMIRAVDQFVDLRSSSLSESVARIRNDRIDVLVDLTGFTQHARTEILASRPAPIQVNFLGFPGTLGADYIDYVLVDRFIVPPDQQPFFTEKLVHLPGCYQVNDSQRVIDSTPLSRCDAGLPADGFVFCSFNSNYKITPGMFNLWMQLLQRVDGSVLWLLEGNSRAPQNLRREAESRGIDPERLVFAPRQPLPRHLARHALADLFLDTFPVNAHTTASDALWAGLPVLTLSGETFVSRVAGSLLTHLELPELVTFSPEEYFQRALLLATAPAQLLSLRRRLELSRVTTPVFDIHQSARAIEKAFELMIQRRRQGLSPAPLMLAPAISSHPDRGLT